MRDLEKKTPDNMYTHSVSNTVLLTPEELFSGKTIEVTIPDEIQSINLNERKFTAQDLSVRAKRLADRYVKLMENYFNPDEDFMKDPEAFAIYLSLLGLSCELYIKSLLYSEQPSDSTLWVSGHDLSALLGKLSSGLQLKIQNNFANCFPEGDVQDEITKMDMFFRKFRYAYEIDGYSVNLYIAQSILGIIKNAVKQLI